MAEPLMPWMIDELAHAGTEHLAPDFVAGFERKQGHPDPSGEVAIFAAHGLGADSTIVDLGAGTGRFALAAARSFGRVTAVDISPAMINHLRERVAESALTNVECVRAGFLTYEHTGSRVDGVHTRHALHQLPDFWKVIALDRIAGMLRPGGILRLVDLIYDFAPSEAAGAIERWMNGAATDPARGYTRDDLAEHVSTEFSTFRWLLEPMLTATGFEIVTAEFLAETFGAYTCRRR